jgi:hypothetical protein
LPSCREIIDAMIWKEASMEGTVIVSDYYLIVIPFVASSRQHLTSPGKLARLVGSCEPINCVSVLVKLGKQIVLKECVR